MQLDRLHQNRVRVSEVSKLPLKLISPFHAMEKIIAKPIHNNQQRRRDVGKLRLFVS